MRQIKVNGKLSGRRDTFFSTTSAYIAPLFGRVWRGKKN